MNLSAAAEHDVAKFRDDRKAEFATGHEMARA
jgi:hypothetical protein